MTTPSDSLTGQPPALLAHRSFVLFWCARTSTAGAYMMQSVAVGWQIYDLTGDPFDLGLVGLVQFVPVVLLALVIGQIADRYDRRAVAGICQVVKALAAAALALGSFQGWLNRDLMLAILFVTGTARAFETPTMHTLVPGLVPQPLLPRAIAASATANQTAIICGPAIGGFLYVFGPTTVYLTCTAVFVIASILVSMIRLQSAPPEKKPITLDTLFAGFDYIRRHPILLGALSLDLFAVLLGGVTALLPIYAKDVLETGPWGLGLLRSAPAVGALAEAAMARGKSVAGTMPGRSACTVGISKARAEPASSRIASMASRPSQPCAVPSASASAASAFPAWQAAMTARRSTRSATWPTTTASATSGTNCTSPTRPRSNGSSVRA